MNTTTKAIPGNAHALVGRIRERVEHIKNLCPDLYSPAKILALLDELSERLVLDQLVASAAKLGIDKRYLEPLPVSAESSESPGYERNRALSFSELETWPEGEELSPGEREEILRVGDGSNEI